jgi:branched-chain amino acid transport system substrate-binding protein
VSDGYEASEEAKLAYALGARKAGLIILNNDYGIGLRDEFTKNFETIGGEVVAIEQFELEEQDFRTSLLKIKEADVDVLYIASNPAEFPSLMQQVRIILGDISTVSNFVVESDGYHEEKWNLFRLSISNELSVP